MRIEQGKGGDRERDRAVGGGERACSIENSHPDTTAAPHPPTPLAVPLIYIPLQ